MSQEKVDQYKKNKANRQKIMRREKILRRLEITVAALVLVGLVSWFSAVSYTHLRQTGRIMRNTGMISILSSSSAASRTANSPRR